MTWYCSEIQKRVLKICLKIKLEHRISPTGMYNIVKALTSHHNQTFIET